MGGCGCPLMANFTPLNLTLISFYLFFYFLETSSLLGHQRRRVAWTTLSDAKPGNFFLFSLWVKEQMQTYYSSQAVSANMDLEHHLPTGKHIAGRVATLPKGPPAGSGLAPTPQTLNRNHKRRGGFLKGFINCDQLPMAVTHVIQAAVMTPSKDFSRGGRRHGRREGCRGGKRGWGGGSRA